MEGITYSWLSCCASAPSVAALSVWVLFIFHTYRRRWRTMDIFLLTIALQEIPNSLCAFGFAVHTVIRSRSESSCQLVIWGLTTTRVFQLTTLTSLAFDRALTLKWPYKYRFSVRHSQIRYHIVVLGVISALVGIAGLFARLQFQDFRKVLESHETIDNLNNSLNKTNSFYCTLHPFSWDFRYNVFISTLFAILALITFFCIIYIEINRYRGPTPVGISRTNSRISSVGNLCSGDHLTPGVGDPLARCESYRTLYGFQPTGKHGSINKKILDDQRAFDLRWPPVIGVLALCYALNHGPYLAFTTGGLFVQFWTPLHDNIVIWFGIIEGILLPIALYITDDPFKEAVKRSFRRKNYRCSDISKSSDGPFPLYFNDFALIDKPYVGAMSSIPTAKLNSTCGGSPLTVVSNYRRSSMRTANANDKHRRTNTNEPLMRTNNTGLSSLRKCKLPKHNDKYMFLSIYGVDKVIPVNKQSISAYSNTGASNDSQSLANPYTFKNSTTLSTFAGSDNSINNKQKLDPNSDEKQIKHMISESHHQNQNQMVWYSNNSGKHYDSRDIIVGNQSLLDTKQLKNKYANDDHIYATLSETFSVRSTLPDKRQLQQKLLNEQMIAKSNEMMGNASNEPNMQNQSLLMTAFNSNHNYAKSGGTASVDGLSMSGVSFTTLANDDFEFTKGSDTLTTDRTLMDDSSDRVDSSSLDSSSTTGSYSVERPSRPQSKSHIYDNLGFECSENNSHSCSQARKQQSSVCSRNAFTTATAQPHHSSSVSAINYLQPTDNNNSSIVSKQINPSNGCYSRGSGRQSYSTSDIYRLDPNVYSMPSMVSMVYNNNQNISSFANIPNKTKRLVDNQLSVDINSRTPHPRKTLSETNLLQSSANRQNSGSLTRIDEHIDRGLAAVVGAAVVGRQTRNDRYDSRRFGHIYRTHSSDSLESNTSTESSTETTDIHMKLANVIKNKTSAANGLSAAGAVRHNHYNSRAKHKPRSRTKKYKTKRNEDNQQIYVTKKSSNNKDLIENQKQLEKINTLFNKPSQSVWSIDSKAKPIHNKNLNGLTRIGSYAQDWQLNKSMPDLCSLDSLDNSCPSPVFSPLYKRDSKKE